MYVIVLFSIKINKSSTIKRRWIGKKLNFHFLHEQGNSSTTMKIHTLYSESKILIDKKVKLYPPFFATKEGENTPHRLLIRAILF